MKMNKNLMMLNRFRRFIITGSDGLSIRDGLRNGDRRQGPSGPLSGLELNADGAIPLAI